MSGQERKLESACMGELERQLPHVLLWKIRDQTTGGQPDLEINWNGATTKIEFKVLKGDETIHDKWEDERQLITLVRYEQQTGRSWAVAWRVATRASKLTETILYVPTRLLRRELPTPCDWKTTVRLACCLWEKGAIRYSGIRHDVVVELIKQTHI